MYELKLTDKKKEVLINLLYDETKKWYFYMIEDCTKQTVPMVDMINAIQQYHICSNLYFELSERDWQEEYELLEILNIEPK
jgi:hypothetical protein